MTDTNSDPEKGTDRKPSALRPWPKGVSGNPGGKKAKTAADKAVEALARASSTEAVNTVLTIMRAGDSDRTRLAASLAILERAHGRPGDRLTEPVEVPQGATLADRAQAIADAAMSGTVSTAQASALLSCLASVAKVREVEELERRITALEAQKGTA
jgi:hypothetical protein